MPSYITKLLPVGMLSWLMFTTGSCIHIDAGGFWDRQVEHERVLELTAPMARGMQFEAQTHNGDITVNGVEQEGCYVTATITGRARRDEDAQRLAEETQVTLESSADELAVKIARPHLSRHQSVGIDLDVTVPVQTDLELDTHNGGIEIKNINGRIEGVTHNGDVVVLQTAGDIDFVTHNGSFYCGEISGNLELLTHNGKISASYSEYAPAVCDVTMVTHNGSVDFKAPLNYSAAVTVSTQNGTITTELPLTVRGSFGSKKITGAIGDGQGNLRLETHNGSIKIR